MNYKMLLCYKQIYNSRTIIDSVLVIIYKKTRNARKNAHLSLLFY